MIIMQAENLDVIPLLLAAAVLVDQFSVEPHRGKTIWCCEDEYVLIDVANVIDWNLDVYLE